MAAFPVRNCSPKSGATIEVRDVVTGRPRYGQLVVMPGVSCLASGLEACSCEVAGQGRAGGACQSTSLIITKKASASGSR